MFRSRSWFGGGLWKPKNPHSLEHLKYLYNVLSKNQTVSENNRGLLVETLRSIAEILIWGDQNDSGVFDFFLEKNMLSFFLRIMKQKCGSYVCVQLLQTLNILFENIRNETSLYYLLSNNHVNSIIVHKFDFSDEEVMAYYISFLKTLSLKLNAHTIHFFYNEHTHDFPLYTEAIKFFNHSEGMVRIAVRTLTLNVYRVEDASMLGFIRDRTAAPYFSNLVWFIGNHILELDTCVRNDADHQSQNRLADLVAEHLDHLHYLNDILCLNIADLNQVLTEHLLQKLLVPLHVFSLTKYQANTSNHQNQGEKKHMSVVVALFLLSQVFLIISHSPLVKTLATILLKSDLSMVKEGAGEIFEMYLSSSSSDKVGFSPPEESLEKSLENFNETITDDKQEEETINEETKQEKIKSEKEIEENTETEEKKNEQNEDSEDVRKPNSAVEENDPNVTTSPLTPKSTDATEESLAKLPFLETILQSLYCTENDYATLFALCLLYALSNNEGVEKETLDLLFMPLQICPLEESYNKMLIDRLTLIMTSSCQTNAKVRLVTLELTVKLLIQLVTSHEGVLQENHLTAVEAAKEHSTGLLRNFYKSEDIFLDMFEDEYSEIQKRPLKVEWLMMDSNILLPPTGTPMTGIEFSKRLPCGEVERARRAIRVFFLIRQLSLALSSETENQLPLTDPASCVQINNVLDLNNSDLIACTVVWKDGQKIKRFLVIDVIQLILVEPDSRKLGWGVAKFVGFLQDIEVIGDKDDSRCLHITIHKPSTNSAGNRIPLLSAKFIFDDHIRCMAAKQRLTKGRIKARQKKMHKIAQLLDIPSSTPPCLPNYALMTLGSDRSSRNSLSKSHKDQRLFNVNKVPGFASRDSRRLEASSSVNGKAVENGLRVKRGKNEQLDSFNEKSSPQSLIKHQKSRDNSPKMPRPRSEEIPLEDMRLRKTSLTSNSSGSDTNHSSGCSTAVSSTSNSENHKPIRKRSEETSFTSPQGQSRPRKKGQVETV